MEKVKKGPMLWGRRINPAILYPLLKQKRIKQVRFVRELGLSSGHISRMFNGHDTIASRHASVIAKALGVPEDDLLLRDNEAEEIDMTKSEREIKQAIEREISPFLACGVSHAFDRGDRHNAVYIQLGDARETVFFSKTASDFRSTKNTIAEVRRALKRIGATQIDLAAVNAKKAEEAEKAKRDELDKLFTKLKEDTVGKFPNPIKSFTDLGRVAAPPCPDEIAGRGEQPAIPHTAPTGPRIVASASPPDPLPVRITPRPQPAPAQQAAPEPEEHDEHDDDEGGSDDRAPRTGKRLTAERSFMVAMLLQKHGKSTGPRRYTYNEGWSDKRIADEAVPNQEGVEMRVRLLRRKMLGLLPTEWEMAYAPKSEELAALTKRVEELEAIVNKIKTDLGV